MTFVYKFVNIVSDKAVIKITTSELIKTVRNELGLSQDELAHAIYVTVTTVSRWENGKSIPSRIALNMLADYCEKQGIDKELIQSVRNAR